jgi:hypothetical protein
MWSGSFATRANTGDPQREQKHRRAPGEDSYSDIKSSPAMILCRPSGIRAFAEKAVPLARAGKDPVTKPNLTYWSQNLELEASTEAFAPYRFRHQAAVCCHGQFLHLR